VQSRFDVPIERKSHIVSSHQARTDGRLQLTHLEEKPIEPIGDEALRLGALRRILADPFQPVALGTTLPLLRKGRWWKAFGPLHRGRAARRRHAHGERWRSTIDLTANVPVTAERRPNSRNEFVPGGIFQDVSERSGRQAGFHQHHVGVHRHQHNAGIWVVAKDPRDRFDTVDPWHADIGNDHVRRQMRRGVHQGGTVLD
jgi:hypothetical protein